MSFLTAEWRKLAMVNYSIDENILKKYIPYKTELDIYEGICYISLVGFLFKNTKLLGLKIPMHTNFEEVNLRFYVRCKEGNNWKRGVVFIKELVPKRALAIVANKFYMEHYHTVPMNHSWLHSAGTLEVEYNWRINKSPQYIKVTANNTLADINPGSETEFITEHYWGYTKVTENKTFEYKVTHPRWQFYKVTDYKIGVDFALLYGKDFGVINELTPQTVMLVEGSVITVENKRKI